MPTTRPRHLLTETDELARALDRAAATWPGVSRPQLLVRLALHGDQAATEARQGRTERRLQALTDHSGIMTGVYDERYLADLREDWPA